MIGNIFSPFYKQAYRYLGNEVDPYNFSAVNLVLYGPKSHQKWVFSEYDAQNVQTTEESLKIAKHHWRWQNGSLHIDLLDETTPWSEKIAGRITLHPLGASQDALTQQPLILSPTQTTPLHFWQPLMPAAHIEVELHQPAIAWQGHAYHDANMGFEPLNNTFKAWHWQRSLCGEQSRIHYHIQYKDQSVKHIHLTDEYFTSKENLNQLPKQHKEPFFVLPHKPWELASLIYGTKPQELQLKTLENSPFYRRNQLLTQQQNKLWQTIQETLHIEQLNKPWSQWMIPYRLHQQPQSSLLSKNQVEQ